MYLIWHVSKKKKFLIRTKQLKIYKILNFMNEWFIFFVIPKSSIILENCLIDLKINIYRCLINRIKKNYTIIDI